MAGQVTLPLNGSYTYVNSQQIDGTTYGVYSPDNVPANVTNNSAINASSTAGVGVFLADGGSVTNNANATITGGGYGVETGPDNGATTVTNSGQITGTNGVGVSLAGPGTVTNTGAISGGGGVSVVGTGMVTNSKTITATANAGVTIDAGGTVTNNASATINGVTFGVSINGGTPANVTVNNYNVIGASGTAGVGVFLANGGTVNNYANTTISGGGYGVETGPGNGATTLVNNGQITGTNGIGVSLAGPGTVTNTGTISGGGGVSIVGTGMVTNSKTITATANAGVTIDAGGTVANNAGATINGVTFGVSINGGTPANVTVNNYNVIGASGTAGVGVFLANGGTVNNYANTTISGGGYGVETGPGNGATTLVNNGQITGTNGIGVSLAGPGTVTNTGTISGGGGITIVGFGTLTNSMTITATANAGVTIDAGGTVTNNANATINGITYGVSINAGDPGNVMVNNYNVIGASGTAGVGVFLANGGTVNNHANTMISGGGYGIETGPGNGATIVTNNGQITGTNGIGVSLAGAGNVTNTGVISGGGGITIVGAGMVTNTNTITGTANSGVMIDSGGSVTNGAGDNINGITFGVSINGAGATNGTVTNSGGIRAAGAAGVGVFLANGGMVTNNANATISGGGYGVETGPGQGATTVINSSQITGANGIGISLAGPGVVTNAGTISGGGGITIVGPGYVANMGTITATTAAGVTINGGGGVVNATFNTIAGVTGGVSIDNGGNVTNNGSITASGDAGIGVELGNGGAVENLAPTAVISGGGDGVEANGPAAVVNAGQITSMNGTGVAITAAGTVTNANLIKGHEGVSITGAGQVTNVALITATTGGGVTIDGGGEMTNVGSVSGVTGGVEIQGASGSVTNDGSITASATSGTGVTLANGGSVSNNAGGAIITGGANGVASDNGDTTVTNKGTITGTNGVGVELAGKGAVTNSKTITGGGGVTIDGAGQVTNSGAIQGTTSTGVSIGDGGSVLNLPGASIAGVTGGLIITGAVGTAINWGDITATASSSYGVDLTNGGTLDNLTGGNIDGGAYGVETQGQTATNIENNASISGQIGILFGGPGTIVDGGSIASTSGASGTAIELASSGSTFILDQGATLTGGIEGFGAGDTLEFGVGGATVNGYQTSAGPAGMTKLTLTDNGAPVVSVDLIGNSGNAFSLYQAPGSQFVVVTPGSGVTSASVTTFENEQSTLDQINGGFDIVDMAQNIENAANLLNADPHIDSISASDAPVSVGVATLLSDETALNKVLGGFDISDQASTIAQNMDAIEADIGRINAITALNGPVVVPVATFDADEPALNEIGAFAISDSAANIAGGIANLEADASKIGTISATGGPVIVDASEVGPNQAILDKIVGGFEVSGFGAGNPIVLPTLAYKSSYQAEFFAGDDGGVLVVVDTSAGDQVVASFDLTGNLSGGFASLAPDPTQGVDIGYQGDPLVAVAAGDVLVSNVGGQAYTAYADNYNQGSFTGITYYFTNVPAGAAYSSYEYEFSAGNDFIGSGYAYTAQAGAGYTGFDDFFNGAGQLTSADYIGVSGQPFSSYEDDYGGGVLSGLKYTYTNVPAGATYSSYVVDYNYAGAFSGEQFFYTNITGQSYSGEEVDLDASGELSRVLLTGVSGAPYSSVELDYSAGAFDGAKYFFTGVTGQSYTAEEVDVSASNQLEKVVYSGITTQPYSSVEFDYSGGAVSAKIFDFTDVTGQAYYADQVEQTPAGANLQQTLDMSSGGHDLFALAGGQTLTSLGDDSMVGNGATTFVLNAIYGADTIANFTAGDTISLPSSEFTLVSQVQSAATPVGNNVLITANDGDKLVLDNMTVAGLATTGAFVFHP